MLYFLIVRNFNIDETQPYADPANAQRAESLLGQLLQKIESLSSEMNDMVMKINLSTNATQIKVGLMRVISIF